MNISKSKGGSRPLLKKIPCAILISALILGGCEKSARQSGENKLTTSASNAIQVSAATSDPTSGWTQVSYTYSIETPWNLPQSDRYSYSGGVHNFWIYQGDSCQYQGCSTGPRSELRMNNNYTTGTHQFEGDVYIDSGSSGTDVMQIFGGVTNATAIMLKIHPENGGTLERYDDETLMTSAYNKWIHVNVQHDAGSGKICVYLNNVLKGTYADRGSATHYFKCGVYNISGSKSETHWKNIKNWENGPLGQ